MTKEEDNDHFHRRFVHNKRTKEKIKKEEKGRRLPSS
jgi:hypothetical protein